MRSTTVGDLMISGRAVIGKPIVEAYKQERLQDWIGCKLSDKCIREISKKRFDEFIKDCTILKYEIPLKSGKVHKQYAFNWIAPIEYACKCENRGKPVTREQLIKVTSFLDKNHDIWDARRKVSNTKQFREHAIDVTLRQAALAVTKHG